MFQIKSTIEKVSTLANNCLSILIHTADISLFTSDELAKIFKMKRDGQETWTAFSEMEVKESDLDIKDDIGIKQKSLHERLMSTILAYTKMKTGKFDGARELYREDMERLCDNYKDKMRELEDKPSI